MIESFFENLVSLSVFVLPAISIEPGNQDYLKRGPACIKTRESYQQFRRGLPDGLRAFLLGLDADGPLNCALYQFAAVLK